MTRLLVSVCGTIALCSFGFVVVVEIINNNNNNSNNYYDNIREIEEIDGITTTSFHNNQKSNFVRRAGEIIHHWLVGNGNSGGGSKVGRGTMVGLFGLEEEKEDNIDSSITLPYYYGTTRDDGEHNDIV